jgi:hypothetical protein
LKVAVVLTGELRYIDYCKPWWDGVIQDCDYDVSVYSCTWGHLNNAFIDQTKRAELENQIIKPRPCNPSTALGNMYPGFEYLVVDDSGLTTVSLPSSLEKYVEYKDHGLPYYLGRTYQLQRAIMYWRDLKDYDVIVHSRWDTAFRNTNFFNEFILSAKDNIVFRDMNIRGGLLYSCDWAYAGPAPVMYKHYIDAVNQYANVFEHYYKKDPTTAYTFLIGHNIHSTYMQHQLLTLKDVNFDATLVRKHEMEFDYSDNQWQKLLNLFLG